MHWAFLGDWQTLISTGVAVLAGVLAWINVSRQLAQSRALALGSNTMKLAEYLQSEHVREARYRARDLRRPDYSNVTEDETRVLSTVCSSYDLAGIYARKGYVDLELIVDNWGPSIIENYEGIKDYIKVRRLRYEATRPSGVAFWDDFEWLYEQSLIHYEGRATGARPGLDPAPSAASGGGSRPRRSAAAASAPRPATSPP